MYLMCTEEVFSLPLHDSAGYKNTKEKQLNKVDTALNG